MSRPSLLVRLGRRLQAHPAQRRSPDFKATTATTTTTTCQGRPLRLALPPDPAVAEPRVAMRPPTSPSRLTPRLPGRHSREGPSQLAPSLRVVSLAHSLERRPLRLLRQPRLPSRPPLARRQEGRCRLPPLAGPRVMTATRRGRSVGGRAAGLASATMTTTTVKTTAQSLGPGTARRTAPLSLTPVLSRGHQLRGASQW